MPGEQLSAMKPEPSAGGHLPNCKVVQAALNDGYRAVCSFIVVILSSIVCIVFVDSDFFYCFCLYPKVRCDKLKVPYVYLYEVIGTQG